MWFGGTPEEMILDTIEDFYWLRDGGLSEQIALEQIEAHHTGKPDIDLESNITVSAYVVHRLKAVDPLYLDLGQRHLDRSLEIAERWVKNEIERTVSEPSYPPTEWLLKLTDASMVESGPGLPYSGTKITAKSGGRDYSVVTPKPKQRDWERIKIRMVPGDELWTFSSPLESWSNLSGRMGITLVRNGHAIGHALTMMN
jgi:hypothetical protein